ncbi:MAG: DUF1329 domain-containing protein [Deltaproteobacteria bacterium]|nr:DUF1329 domain-containing protein [Deltaproteobacteria bacterium]
MRTMSSLFRAAAALALLALASPAHADGVATGQSWILDSNNWQQAQDLLPPPVLDRVKKGDYWFKVQPIDPEKFKHNYSDAFWAASEANAGKYDLDAETCGLKDVATGEPPKFYFGYPFPKVDPKDPQAGCKMAWNFVAATNQGGGGGATFTLNGIDSGGEYKRIKAWIHSMAFLGRHGGPVDNPENLALTALTGVLEPSDIDGVGGLVKRTNTWTSQDKSWFYVPATRRVRQASSAARSEPVGGMDIFADDINCYAGKVEYYKWKVIGEGNILAGVLQPDPLIAQPVTASRTEVKIPYFKGAYETPGAKGAPWLIVDNLVLIPRPVWVLEGESTDPYYNFGKVIMYMDKDLYRIYWKLVHNRAGEYFYNAMCAYHWSKTADGSFSAVSPNLVVGVNDKTNRAALGGRYSSQFFEKAWPEDYFSLRTLTHLSD